MTEDKLKEAWDLFLKERELSYSSSLNPWEMFKAGYEAGTKQKLNIASVVRPEVESAQEGELLGNEAKATVAEAGVDKWCDSCGKVTLWVNDECVNYTKKKAEALTRSNRD